MCVIAISAKGIKQPTMEQLRNCFENNPHGAGYMYACKGEVHIHKGFMTWEDFERAVRNEHFTEEDPVVYHFRITTQAGVKPSMTHPFPLTPNIAQCEALDVTTRGIGLAHNGIIRMTTNYKETRYSDTALFVAQYMTKLLRKRSDADDLAVLTMIENLTNSKWAILTPDGEIRTVGHFITTKGLMFSNDSYLPPKPVKKAPYSASSYAGKPGKYPTYHSYDYDDCSWIERDYMYYRNQTPENKKKDSKSTKDDVIVLNRKPVL